MRITLLDPTHLPPSFHLHFVPLETHNVYFRWSIPCGPQHNCFRGGNVSLLLKCSTFLISYLLTFLPPFLLLFLPRAVGDAFRFGSDATINSGREAMVQKVTLGRGEQSVSASVFPFCPRPHLTFRLREHLWPAGLVRKHVRRDRLLL